MIDRMCSKNRFRVPIASVAARQSGMAQCTDGMTGEGQQVERGQDGREIPAAMPKVMFQVIPMIFHGVETLVLDLPSRPATGRRLNHVAAIDRQVGDETVAMGHFARGADHFDHQPVDRHRVLIAA